MNKKQKSLNNKGFSLVELIIVIAIMAVLIGVLAPQYIGYVKKSRVATDLQNAESVATQIAVVLADKEAGTATSKSVTENSAVWTEVTTTEVDAVPTSKVDKTNKFYYKVDNHTVHVAIGTSATAAKEVYPTRPATGDYKAD